ncbi:hypothetical protein [Devosia ginsengisoli]|uniref:hypothetical protein n=1 Tax=Devosia ginsengisoli TaxID=400770 RepID=UPI0026ED106D|nr:hypothetical protein [Devosia ginsengisoli]MCR6671239.1 hypothetical protein [Devosia ginsengisoli]
MKPLALAIAAMLAGASAPAHAVSETAEGFAAAMQGCWNRASWSADIDAQRADPGYSISSQMCLSGGVEGALTLLDCGGVNNLVECNQAGGRYVFAAEKFQRIYDDGLLAGGSDSCDVFLEAGRQFTLRNCQWVVAPAAAEAIGDVVYERAIGQ